VLGGNRRQLNPTVLAQFIELTGRHVFDPYEGQHAMVMNQVVKEIIPSSARTYKFFW